MNLSFKRNLNLHRRYYSSTTVNPFEDFKPEILILGKESQVKVFINIRKLSYGEIMNFILSNLIEIIQTHNGDRLFIKLYILEERIALSAMVKGLCSFISPDLYGAIYIGAFHHLRNKQKTSSFRFINVNTSIIKSFFKIGPRESNKYFFGFSDDEILKMTPKLKSTSKKTNSILSENKTTLPNS